MNISEFCKIYTGTGFPIEFQGKKNGKYPFYKVSDISVSNTQQKIFLDNANNYIDEFDLSILKGNLIPAGTIVFAKIGEALKLNKRAITSCECLIDNNVIGIKPDDNIINLLYFYYYLLKIDMLHYSESTTLPSVRKSTIEQIKVKIPPIDVQNKRVTILNICHKIIKNQVKLIHNLDLLVKSRFVEMFGDPNMVGLNKSVKFSSIAKIMTGNTPSRKSPEYYGDYIEWIKSDNIISTNLYISQAKEFLSEQGAAKGRVAPKDSLLMTCIAGSIRSIGNVGICDRSVAFNQQINAIVLKNNINPLYIYWLLKLFKPSIIANVEMSLKGIISKSQLENMLIPIIASQEEQELFIKFALQINKLKSDVRKSIDETQLLMDSLMQEYFG